MVGPLCVVRELLHALVEPVSDTQVGVCHINSVTPSTASPLGDKILLYVTEFPGDLPTCGLHCRPS